MGRTLQKNFKNKDKFVVTVNLMENPKTGELMSKSRGTGVFLNTSPFDKFGSIMSQPDEMIRPLLINNTRISLEEIEDIMKLANPRDAKVKAAYEITRIFHGEELATQAMEQFVNRVQNKEIGGDDLPVCVVKNAEMPLFELLRECLLQDVSNSEIRRLLSQNSIKIEGDTVSDPNALIKIPQEGLSLKVGKKQWFKVVVGE
jgi:tyrosyl-tRNA synthetase